MKTVLELVLFLTNIFLLRYVGGTKTNAKCDQLGILLYEDMSCKPIYDSVNSVCPTRFDCLGLKKSNSHCYFKGRPHRAATAIDSKETVAACKLGCFCEKGKDENMRFKCASLDCPEWNGSPPNPGCYRKYSIDDCCSIKEMCSPFDNSTTCEYDGRVYKEGENFLPAGTCWRCVCGAGFKGILEAPFCRRRACGTEIERQGELQRRCAPVYYRGTYRETDPLCCPAMWTCSEGNEKITGRPKSDKKCMFGQKILRIGQGFKKKISMAANMTISCECKLPPLVTCISNVL